MNKPLLVIAFLALYAEPACAASQPVLPEVSCDSLATVDLTSIGGNGSRISVSKETTLNGKKVCSVEGTLAPSIGFKVQLPVNTWTGRYLQVGCGGLCGHASLTIGAADGCPVAEANGFVVAATNMGHEGGDGAFTSDPQKREDFAFRAQHLTSETAKRLIEAYYGRPPSYNYFTGCSDGGREALVEAQRYPEDFNGIIAGAAAINFQVQNSLYHGWQASSNTDAEGKSILLASRLPILHQAVVKACDALDGQEDGLIADPRACHFDPATIQCTSKSKNTGNCLTSSEVVVAKKFYEGPKDPTTREQLTAGQPQYGSELAWAGVYVPFTHDQKTMSEKAVVDAVHQIFTDMPDTFTLKDLRFTKETFDRLKTRHPFNDGTDPDLSAFVSAGGKLILWHGWADPHISPINTIAYHKAVQATMGSVKTASFERLYLFPGMYHCSGGEGPNSVDLLTPMMNWVEKGEAPDAVIAHKKTVAQIKADMPGDFGQPQGIDGGDKNKGNRSQGRPMAMTELPSTIPDVESWRPVYPYPYLSVYSGKDDANKAESYHRAEAPSDHVAPAWVGSDFFTPYQKAK